jgi:hypothetical protein
MTKLDLSRRTFVTTALAAGGGLMLGFHVPAAQAANLSLADASKAPVPWWINSRACCNSSIDGPSRDVSTCVRCGGGAGVPFRETLR